MDNQFESKGKDQNIGQGDGAIGKQVNNYGISSEVFAQYVKELGATEQIVRGFFATLLEQEVPRDQWDSKLREIAGQYKELLLRLETVQSEDLQMVKLKKQAKQAIEAVDYAKAEALLNQAEERDMQLIEELERAVRQRRISTAASYADNARLQRAKGDLAKAEQYINRAVELAEEIGHPKLEEWRKALEEVQVERRGRRDVSQNTPTVFRYSAQGVTLRLLNITPLGQGESARLS
jgi:tetratricopeptide (TPR) repeat protein